MQKKGRRMAGPLSSVGKKRSVAGGDRAAPAEPVVQTGLYGVLVVADAVADNFSRAAGEGGAAEIVILVLELGRPVRSEHVFQAGADSVAVIVVAGGGEGHARAAKADADIVVAPGVTALGVEQRRTPSVAEAAGHRAA